MAHLQENGRSLPEIKIINNIENFAVISMIYMVDNKIFTFLLSDDNKK